jgi:hypothetical protein
MQTLFRLALAVAVTALLARAAHTQVPTNSYIIIVKTGENPNAGTDANVFITLHGAFGSSEEWRLDNFLQDDFERGDRDVFSKNLPDLGELTSIRIRHDNSGPKPGWWLWWVRVQQIRNYRKVREWEFMCWKWLARDEPPDFSLDRELPVTGSWTF